MKKSFFAAVLVSLSVVSVCGQGFDFGGTGGFPTGTGAMPANPALEKGRDRAEDALDKVNGYIPMRFFNALDRTPVSGASIEIPTVGTIATDNAGKIAFPKIPDGSYTMVFSKAGFVTTPIEFRVLLGSVPLNWYSVSPEIPDKDYRIVLEWAERPADLDIHFEKIGGYHISYFNMHQAEDGNAVLDRDDRSGYGPETVTVGRLDRNAVYTCYVHDYTNRSNSGSTQMAREGAVVRVYSFNRLVHTFHIPSGGAGTKWEVFRIERGALIPVNTVSAR